MALKLLVFVYLLQAVLVNPADAQFPRFHPEVEEVLKNLSRSNFELQNCDRTLCSRPCPGSMPPLRCPPDVPKTCHFGCACYTDCRSGVIDCFEINHCLKTGRFFTARRRAKMS